MKNSMKNCVIYWIKSLLRLHSVVSLFTFVKFHYLDSKKDIKKENQMEEESEEEIAEEEKDEMHIMVDKMFDDAEFE